MRMGEGRRRVLTVVWGLLVCGVAAGSLLPASSPEIVAVSRLHVNDKVLHYVAYLVVSMLPVAVFPNAKAGMRAGLSMFVLSLVLEALQRFSPGRAVQAGDIVSNAAGVACGVLLGQRARLPADWFPLS
jgi:VanZ family protein